MPSGSRAEKAAKRDVVARGVIAGRSTKAIARAAGCTERHVQRLADEPETQFLITELMRPHRRKLDKLATKAIAAVEKALAANKTDKADHTARLRAVERFGELAEMAQGLAQAPPASDPTVTWEEFVVMYRSRKEQHDDKRQLPEAL
jgi:hypothetical protein